MTVFQCVPNFSEGRDNGILEAIAEAMRGAGSAKLINYSADWDHHRSVYTLLGDADGIFAAMCAGAKAAVERIDLRQHSGVHPCAGAVDVVPVVPLQEATMADAKEIAEKIGAYFAEELKIPVRFYEQNTRAGRDARLPIIRNAASAVPFGQELTGEAAPDLGSPFAHDSAGIAIVGARAPLVAYNVNLSTPDVRIARTIARRIWQERDTNPILTGVRALGLFLETPQIAQVSLNLTQPDKTPLPPLFRWIRAQAQTLEADAIESEIIGAIPLHSLCGEEPDSILWKRYNPDQILETWLGIPSERMSLSP